MTPVENVPFKNYRTLLIPSYLLFLVSIVLLLLPLIVSPLVNNDYYFRYPQYSKNVVKIDTMEILPKGKSTYHFVGKIKSKSNFYVTATDDIRMDSMFQVNNHKLLVFFKDYESQAYFVEDDFQEMSFKTIWVPHLQKLGLFILIMLNFLFWRYKYLKAILATGMSLEEYNQLLASKRPKRESLEEEYEELMRKENEKKKD